MSNFIRGNQLLRSGKLEEAIATYRRAIYHHPNFHWYHYKLGEALQKSGHLEDAIASYQKAIKLNSNYAFFYYTLGMALIESGKVKSGIEVLKTGSSLNPNLIDDKYDDRQLRKTWIQQGEHGGKSDSNYKEAFQIKTDLNSAFKTHRKKTKYHRNFNLISDLNLALGKPTAQSSVLQPAKYGYDPQGACNGNKTGKFGFHTEKENRAWWQIDLQGVYQLFEIRIYNRLNFKERASTLDISLSQDALNWKLFYSNHKENLFGGIDGKPLRVNCPYKVARFLRLQLRENEYFHLDEVEIYGIPFQQNSPHLNDEATLYVNFYGKDSLPPPPPILQGVVARRVDGLGTRLMCILSARYASEYFVCNMYVSWPGIKSRYYHSNLLDDNSLEEIFENGKIFKDIDISVLKEEDFYQLKPRSITDIKNTVGAGRNGCFLIFNKKQTEIISQSRFINWDDRAMVPYGITIKEVSLKIKNYWKKINWHPSILEKIKNFQNTVKDKPYLVVHLRRGDIIQRLLYDKIPTLHQGMRTIFVRFLPIKTAVKFVLNSDLKDVVVCSECYDSTRILIDEVQRNNHSVNFYVTSELTSSLSETQAAAYDLIIMSGSASILTSTGSSFSTCAEFVGYTERTETVTDWENIANELLAYIDKNDNEMKNERKSLVCLHISKYIKNNTLAQHYINLSKQYSYNTFIDFFKRI